jgi:hypothetical protein
MTNLSGWLARSSVLFCGWHFVPASFAGSLFEWFNGPRDLEAITVTDVSPAGKQLGEPSPEKPLYFAAISGGYHDYGAYKAGEKRLARRAADETVLKVLAKQGYLPAGPGQEPDLILAWRWGTFNTEYFLAPNGYTYRGHHGAKLRFLGGYKLGLSDPHDSPFPEQTLATGLSFQSHDGSILDSLAEADLYVAVITAYAPKLSDAKRSVVLWRTRISCPATGFWLPEAFPSMLAIAAPYIGRETKEPVRIRASDRFNPEVNYGELQLVEYLKNQSSPPVVLEVGPSS